MKQRLDQLMVEQGLANTRSHAARLIRLGRVEVNGHICKKQGQEFFDSSKISVIGGENYVSRAGFKLASVAKKLRLNFNTKTVLDVGSSTGGFTDYALQHGAKKVIAVDVGTKQLHHSLLSNDKIDLHEKTDIRKFNDPGLAEVNITVIDVSFISLREIIPGLAKKLPKKSLIVAMVKPQFESGDKFKHKGVVKNDKMRRQILKDFEAWAKDYTVILDKSDSEVAGAKGNKERFYLLRV